VRIATEYGVKLAWENVAWCMSSSPEFLRCVADEMKEDIYFTLDIKQAIRAGHNPVEYLDVYKDAIINVHINDASAKSSCLLPGKGEVDLKTIVHRVQNIDRNIPFIIEVYRDNFENFNELREAKEYIESIGL
jgi:sugar phosphate isomerase/epimerase